MATTALCSSNIPTRPSHSCIRCAERKVKCDRKIPCGACVRHNVDCIFNSSQPPRNRRKRLNTQILTDRLRHYEALLRENGIDPTNLQHFPDSKTRPRPGHTAAVVPTELQLHIPAPLESERYGSVNKAQIIQDPGRFRFINNILWTRMVEEASYPSRFFHDPKDALGESSNDESDTELSDDDFSFVLGNQLKSSTKSHHPPPEGIYQLWQIFVENVDPLTKVLNVPTLQPAIEKAANNTGEIPRGFEALMFAIYSAAVMSLKDNECKQRLGESRRVLLPRYISATKAALSRARFMGNTSLVILQALIIHLLAVRDIYEPRAVWSLTGVAIRIAQSMGLDRDGVCLGLPPFETEMRRRIWWQLKTHDFRTAELCGITKFHDLHIDAESTKWPTNINDNQLYPGMASLATEPNMPTDAVFISLKCELLKFAAGRVANFRRQAKTSDPWDLYMSGSDTEEIGESFGDIEELLETKYLRYCDPSQPLHLMAMLMARCSINILRFLSHHPRKWTSIEQSPLSERQWVWKVCLKILEQQNMLQSNPHLKRFAWHAPYFQQWHAIIHILDTLRASPLALDANKAWKIISSTYENNPEMASDMRKPIHIAVGNLSLKAYSNRETALQNEDTCPPPTPHFIIQLRQQCEAAKTKRQARHAKNSQPKDPINHDEAKAPNNDRRPTLGSDTSVNNLSDTLESTYLKPRTTSLPPDITPSGPSISLERDPFWFTYGFNDSQVSHRNDVNMDLDFMLDQNYNAEDNATQSIMWDQWDSWLADSNLTRSL